MYRGLVGVLSFFSFALAGCQTLPHRPSTSFTAAFRRTRDTSLGHTATAAQANHPGVSGIHLLSSGTDAFAARIALARAAERSIDLQYYLLQDDHTGRALIAELLHAAQRGVRVRMLIDDIRTEGKEDFLSAFASFPNVSVRIFNPFGHRTAHWLDFISDFGRVGRRMHNKSFTVDNQFSIVGGRNIGDNYFAATPEMNFNDLDVLAVGPVVRGVSAVFDDYWNSPIAYPMKSLHARTTDSALRQLQQTDFEQSLASAFTTLKTEGFDDDDLATILNDYCRVMHWGPAQVIADRPSKVVLPEEDEDVQAFPKFRAFLQGAESELFLISPYFIPGQDGTWGLMDAAHRGVHVRVLTNSFLATDVPLVHGAYMTYRRSLLKAGVELYELKPSGHDMLSRVKRRKDLFDSAHASLHAKAYMVDGRKLFVGSFNLDGRSAKLNTEMGIIMENRALCTRLHNVIEGRLLDAAYRVELDPQTNHLVWITRENGQEVRLKNEPGIGFVQRCWLFLERILPLESQL